jgi:threonine/homoserine/homoserine lactone efflux protein
MASIQVQVDSAWTAGLVLAASRASAVWRRVAVRERLERALGLLLITLGLELAVEQRWRGGRGDGADPGDRPVPGHPRSR